MKTKSMIFAVLFGFALSSPLPCFADPEDLEGLRDKRKDIVIINLLNSLDLRRDQAEFLLQKAREAQAVAGRARDRIAGLRADLEDSYDAVKKEVSSGRVVLEETTQKKFHRNQEQIETLLRQARDKVHALAESVQARLEPYQKLALDDFKACIVPKGTQGRIGQSDPLTGFVKMLAKVREIPDILYAVREPFLIEKIYDKGKSKWPSGEEPDAALIKTEIKKALAAARRLDDADFQLQKESLAQGLQKKVLPEERKVKTVEKIKKFLLCENAVGILEERLAAQKT